MNDKLKKFFKDKNNLILFVILIIGVIILLFSGTQTERTSADTDDTELCNMLESIDGAGRVNILVTYDYSSGEKHPHASGAVITAEGADDPTVRKTISDAVCASLDLPPHKIAICKGSVLR